MEAIKDSVEEVKLVMTTMNGLPRSWDPFIKGTCSRRKLTKFSRLWEDCTQEEARLEAREEKLGNEENHVGQFESSMVCLSLMFVIDVN